MKISGETTLGKDNMVTFLVVILLLILLQTCGDEKPSFSPTSVIDVPSKE